MTMAISAACGKNICKTISQNSTLLSATAETCMNISMDTNELMPKRRDVYTISSSRNII